MSEQDEQLRAVEEARAMMGESMLSQGSQNPLERSLELSTGGGLAASSTTPAAAAKSDSRPKTYRQRLKPDGTKMSLAEIRAQEVAEEEAEEEAEYQKQLEAKRAKQAEIDAAKRTYFFLNGSYPIAVPLFRDGLVPVVVMLRLPP